MTGPGWRGGRDAELLPEGASGLAIISGRDVTRKERLTVVRGRLITILIRV